MKSKVIPVGFDEKRINDSMARSAQVAVLESKLPRPTKEIVDAIISYFVVNCMETE